MLLVFGVPAAARDGSESKGSLFQFKELKSVACGILAVWAVTAASPVIAAGQVDSSLLLKIFHITLDSICAQLLTIRGISVASIYYVFK